jgi:hypothetical protein
MVVFLNLKRNFMKYLIIVEYTETGQMQLEVEADDMDHARQMVEDGDGEWLICGRETDGEDFGDIVSCEMACAGAIT